MNLQIISTYPPLPPPTIDLLLALPRPKVLRRLWPVLAELGLGKVVLCGAERVEKSFFTSKVLSPHVVREGLVKGLEQAGDTQLPDVLLSRTLRGALAVLSCAPYGWTWDAPGQSWGAPSLSCAPGHPWDAHGRSWDAPGRQPNALQTGQQGAAPEGVSPTLQLPPQQHQQHARNRAGQQHGLQQQQQQQQQRPQPQPQQQQQEQQHQPSLSSGAMRGQRPAAGDPLPWGVTPLVHSRSQDVQAESQQPQSSTTANAHASYELQWGCDGGGGGGKDGASYAARVLAHPRPDSPTLLAYLLACLHRGNGHEHLNNKCSGQLQDEGPSHQDEGHLQRGKESLLQDSGKFLHEDKGPSPQESGELREPCSRARILIAIGPEGGWQEAELELLTSPQVGFQCVQLGSRILTTTTALVAAVTTAQQVLKV
ncbi:hypothetical protein DUNSADRAFT_10941 [Dunaliella salina]|uniref:16S rRNA (uracil(1498)-N(3))-methyltransferase n=1 Tax=Dunaliella salina TaxID=3046 RepID=A0ABQ7GEF6_DUNSA|nr:hypothetical protein DUNSADRAFT_10941 [Dunaliella salina]|eukprot:KAF5832985.1 hypothetical protein DUNSADRAFT_10941 [Dunaliella salina]